LLRSPTLVLHRRRDGAIPERAGRELAAGIAGARFVELAGNIHLAILGDVDQLVREIAAFLGPPAPTLAGETVPQRYHIAHAFPEQSAPTLAEETGPVRYEIVHRDLLGTSLDTQPRCRVGLAQIDVSPESLAPAGDGLVTLRPDAEPGVARKLAGMLERAAAH